MKSILLLSAVLMSGQAAAGQLRDRDTGLLWEIGGATAGEEASWVHIDRGVIGRHMVVVSDTRAPSVRAYDLDDGRWITTYGAAGNGPGEYEAPSEVVILGDTVRIHDLTQRRWSFFSLDGSHHRTTSAGHPPAPVHLRWSRMTGGGQGLGLTAATDYGQGDVGRSVIFWQGSAVDTVYYFSMNEVFFQWKGYPQWWSTHFGIGATGDAAVVGDSMMAVLDGMRGEVCLIHAEDRVCSPSRSFDLGERGGPIATADKEWIVDQVIEGLNGQLHPRWDDQLRTPERWSAWTAILSDLEGSVWIRKGGRDHAFRKGGEMWHQLSLESGLVASRIQLPPDTRLLAVQGELLLTVRTDALDIEYLQLRELR